MKSKSVLLTFYGFSFLTLVFMSCKENEKKSSLPETEYSKSLGSLKHSIPITDGAEMVRQYIDFKDSVIVNAKNGQRIYFPNYHTFNLKEIQNIMNQDSVVGIRVYFGLKNNRLVPILTGVTNKGDDYYPRENVNGVPMLVVDDLSQSCDSPRCIVAIPPPRILANKDNPVLSTIIEKK